MHILSFITATKLEKLRRGVKGALALWVHIQ
jgi:hypothetical protein